MSYYLQQMIRCFSIGIVILCCYNYYRLDILHRQIVGISNSNNYNNNNNNNNQPPRILLLLNDFKQQQEKQQQISILTKSTIEPSNIVQNDDEYDPSSLLFQAARYNSFHKMITINKNTNNDTNNNNNNNNNGIIPISTSNKSTSRPPLSSLIQGWNVTGDVSWLLNYAIVGFPKCGTSTLMYHFAGKSNEEITTNNNKELYFYPHERCELAYNQQIRLIQDLYLQIPNTVAMRGIKCPFNLENPMLSMINYKKYFPSTDFIVGIRHPILWYV